MMKIDKKTLSPCIRNCCLDENDICLGCARHVDEIVGWANFTQEEKIAILDKCTKRVGVGKSDYTNS